LDASLYKEIKFIEQGGESSIDEIIEITKKQDKINEKTTKCLNQIPDKSSRKLKGSSLPQELLDFINLPGNHSLLIKGRPGTGKTIFSLSLIKELKNKQKCIYLTSRVSKRDILHQYPWLKEDELLTPGEEILRDLRLTTPSQAIKEIFDLLRSASCVVIDSWDYFAGLMSQEDRDKAEVSLISSACALGSFIIFVGEREEISSLDHLVDGIVNLQKIEIEGRLVREISLEKLRGVRIRRVKYIFTLHNGIFRCSKPWRWKLIPENQRKLSEQIPPKENGLLPSMIEGLDDILGGGWMKSSINLLEVYEGVGSRYISFLVPSGQAYLQRGGSLIDLPSSAFRGTDIVDNFVKGYISPEPELRLRFILPPPSAEKIGGKYVLPLYLKDPEEAANQFISYCEGLIRRSIDNTLYMIIGLDTLENELGPEGALEFLYHVGSWVKTNDVFCFVILKEGQKIPRRVVHLADTHFKIIPRGGGVIFYGIVPETGAMILETSFEEGYPKAQLIPID